MTTSTPHNDALPVSTSDLTQEVQIRSSTQTQGQLPPKTIMQHFNASVEQFGNSPALHYKPSKVTYSVKWKEVLWKYSHSYSLTKITHSLPHLSPPVRMRPNGRFGRGRNIVNKSMRLELPWLPWVVTNSIASISWALIAPTGSLRTLVASPPDVSPRESTPPTNPRRVSTLPTIPTPKWW